MRMNLSIQDIIAEVLAELFGTGLITFIGCMACVPFDPANPPSVLHTSIAFGLVIMIIILIFGSVSGAHLNPSVTIASIIFKTIDFKMACLYIASQFIGAFLGYGLLKASMPSVIFTSGICMTLPMEGMSDGQTILIEFCVTSVLILVCCGVWDPRQAKNTDGVALKFGFTVAALSIVAGPYTGCSMNPARSLGPAIWNQNFNKYWIYLISPLSAAITMPLIYKLVFWREVTKERDDSKA